MDILNLWSDDPEEVLLDLGFGCDEPDLSGRIPARFINHQSQARGINLQLFLEAQKNRLDLENPDVSNRFRQLEVLQQVTTAFSSLVGSSSSSSPGKALSPEARERRAHVSMLFRRASKKSLSQIRNQTTQDITTPAASSPPCAAPKPLQHPLPGFGDRKDPFKRVQTGLLESAQLSPLEEEQGAGPEPQFQSNVASLITKEGALGPLMEGQPLETNTFLLKRKNPGPARESFEMEEIHSFDESSTTGGAEHLVRGVIRTNSCQSDSSGFLEEPIIPQHAAPGPDLIKALSGLSGGSSEESPQLSSPLMTSSGVHKSPLSSPSSSPQPSFTFSLSSSPVSLCPPKSNPQNSLIETLSDENQSSPASLLAIECEYLDPCSSSTDLQNVTHSKHPSFPSPATCTSEEINTLTLDSSEFEKHSPNSSVCQPLSSQTHDFDGLKAQAARTMSDLTKISASQDDDTTDPAPASPVQDVIHVKINHLSLDFEDTRPRNGKGAAECERQTVSVQTQEPVAYISDTKSFTRLPDGSRLVSKEVCSQTAIDPQVPSCTLHDELLTGTQPEDSLGEVNDPESESVRHSLFVHHDMTDTHSRTEVEPTNLIKIESLDVIFQTSVDGSDSETEDVDAFFQQLESEGRVYWAEPIQVSSLTHLLEESASFGVSDCRLSANSLLPGDSSDLDSFSSLDRAMTIDTEQMSQNATDSSDTPSSLTREPFPSLSTNSNLKPSSRSVSVQMSSSPPSHIVHRKDVPYMTDSKCILPPSLLPLDTSSPFHAVQSWTDLQIQRNTLTKKLSYEALHTPPEEVTQSLSTEMPQRPMLDFSLSPNDSQSHECLPGIVRHYHPTSVSVDQGLWPDEEKDVNRFGNEDEEKLWEGNQTATMPCCCSCDHQWTGCTQNKKHTLRNNPYSLDELEDMVLCLQQFRSVLSNMEDKLCEDQAAVYSALSDQDREKVQDIEELRRAVKQEASELEVLLNDPSLAHHYDDSLKMKMHRLLDEQSLLCSQLLLLGTSLVPNRTVTTQRCLLPWIPPADVSFQRAWDSLSPSRPGSKCICEGLGCSPIKADKLDMMSFFQRVSEVVLLKRT